MSEVGGWVGLALNKVRSYTWAPNAESGKFLKILGEGGSEEGSRKGKAGEPWL